VKAIISVPSPHISPIHKGGITMKTIIKKVKSDKKSLSILLPEDFLHKDIRVTIEIEDNKTEKKLLTDKIKIDTKKWKFKREDVYE